MAVNKVWIVWVRYRDNEDIGIQGVAGIYDNEDAAAKCASAIADVPINEIRESTPWLVQSEYRGESRMC